MFVIEGIKTSLPLHQRIFADPDFIAGKLDTHFLERLLPCLLSNAGSLFAAQMNLVIPPLYAIIDSTLLKTSELAFAEVMAESGVELLQYRHKHATSRRTIRGFQRALCRLSRVRPGRAACSAFHRERSSRYRGAGHTQAACTSVKPISALRARRSWRAGRSAAKLLGGHIDAYSRAGRHRQRTSADYIAFGPIFPTADQGTARPGRRPRFAHGSARAHHKPLVAIGGITRGTRRRKPIEPAPIPGRGARSLRPLRSRRAGSAHLSESKPRRKVALSAGAR